MEIGTYVEGILGYIIFEYIQHSLKCYVALFVTPLCINHMVCHFTGNKLSDTVDDSCKGLSLSVDRKSTTFSEVLAPPYPVLRDQTIPLLYKDRLKKEMKNPEYEPRVHDLIETVTFRTLVQQMFPLFREQENSFSVVGRLKKEIKKLDYELRVHDIVETASFHTFFVYLGLLPLFREQDNPLSVVGVIRFMCGDYQFLVSFIFAASCISLVGLRMRYIYNR